MLGIAVCRDNPDPNLNREILLSGVRLHESIGKVSHCLVPIASVRPALRYLTLTFLFFYSGVKADVDVK